MIDITDYDSSLEEMKEESKQVKKPTGNEWMQSCINRALISNINLTLRSPVCKYYTGYHTLTNFNPQSKLNADLHKIFEWQNPAPTVTDKFNEEVSE